VLPSFFLIFFLICTFIASSFLLDHIPLFIAVERYQLHCPSTMSQLSNRTLKYITSISFAMNPMSSSTATRSMKLILSTLPTKPPVGQNSFPKTSISTIPNEKDQKVSITYSDKKSVDVMPDGLNVRDLIRKVRCQFENIKSNEVQKDDLYSDYILSFSKLLPD